MKKFLLFGLFALVSTPLMAFTPNAKSNDQQSFKVNGGTVYRVDRNGQVYLSSTGIQSDLGLFSQHDVFNVSPPSQSWIANPEVQVSTYINSGLLQGATTLMDGGTNYTNGGILQGTTVQALGQLNFPRNLEFLYAQATGNVVIVGTDCYNRKVTENVLILTSGTIVQSRTVWIGISSITANYFCTTTSWAPGSNTASSSTLYMGTSTGLAMPYQVSFPTDVYRVEINRQIVSSYTVTSANFPVVSPPYSTFPYSVLGVSSITWSGQTAGTSTGSQSDATRITIDVWGIVRKSIYSSNP